MQSKILVGTTDGLHEVDGERRILLGGHEVTSLASGDAGWWAIIYGREIWGTGSDGAWDQVAPALDTRGNCLLATAAGLFVGASEARLFALRGETLEPVRAFDKTEGQESWYTPWRGPPDVRSMSADPAGALYVNVHVGGVPHSADGGVSWKPTIDINSDVHQVLFDGGSGRVLAASARGLAVSEDAGQSWRFETDELHGAYLRAVAVAGETVLVSASTGPYTNRAAVYHRPLDGAEPFQRCRNGLPEWYSDNIDTFCLAAPGSVAAFGTNEGSVFLSSDEGRSWEVVAEGLPPVRRVALA